ncbi:hypothetical protein PSMK_05160 [Phycisphaera mikurensis NBRC 102666]|uniref:LamG-like jellyroll fold domain-containing protein n=1 Tax=Phycisphaera mikurensis (strain NBRC 102666 / KCTC 22515 / FYK2301M01) TaxID=1142394 RepID=I0IBN7_PHYMF|nr:hypothetical protein PSMK_05160 [Phycisphaera mikurensis NBRC 102666]
MVSSLKGHWRLDEIAGSTASSGVAAVHATLLADAAFAPAGGRLGGALSLSGSGSAAVVGNVHDPGSGSQTASIWFRRPGGGAIGNDQFLFSKGNRYSTREGWSLNLESSTQEIRFRVNGSDSSAQRASVEADLPQDDRWHHLAAVIDRDAGTLRAYLDGDGSVWRTGGGGPTTRSLASVTHIDTDDPLTLGAVHDGHLLRGNFTGLLDDARIYDRGLGELEIQALASGATRFEPEVTATGSSSTLTAGAPSTLGLHAEHARPDRWAIDWGDGTSEELAGAAASRVHTFAGSGSPQQIAVTAFYGTEAFQAPIRDGGAEADFALGGRAVLDTGSRSWIRDGAVQRDGKLVVAGGPNFTVARFLADGTPDASFGPHGTGVVEIPTAGEGQAVALQRDGKIVVAGGSWFSLARLNLDGSPDTGFGSAGTGVVDDTFGSTFEANDLLIQDDGRIVLAGDGAGDFILARFDPDGRRDHSFGGPGANGRVQTDLYGARDSANAIAAGRDGRLYVTGRTTSAGSSDYDVALAAYSADGGLDRSFGSNGRARADFGDDDEAAFGIDVQPDGRVVVAGRSRVSDANSYDFATARFTAGGFLDASFGGDGTVTTHLGRGYDAAYGVVVLNTGQLLIGGRTSGLGTTNGYDYGVVRLDADGSRDLTFGEGGVSAIDFEGERDDAEALVVGNDGRIFLIGRADGKIGVAATTGFAAPDSGGSFGAGWRLATMKPHHVYGPTGYVGGAHYEHLPIVAEDGVGVARVLAGQSFVLPGDESSALATTGSLDFTAQAGAAAASAGLILAGFAELEGFGDTPKRRLNLRWTPGGGLLLEQGGTEVFRLAGPWADGNLHRFTLAWEGDRVTFFADGAVAASGTLVAATDWASCSPMFGDEKTDQRGTAAAQVIRDVTVGEGSFSVADAAAAVAAASTPLATASREAFIGYEATDGSFSQNFLAQRIISHDAGALADPAEIGRGWIQDGSFTPDVLLPGRPIYQTLLFGDPGSFQKVSTVYTTASVSGRSDANQMVRVSNGWITGEGSMALDLTSKSREIHWGLNVWDHDRYVQHGRFSHYVADGGGAASTNGTHSDLHLGWTDGKRFITSVLQAPAPIFRGHVSMTLGGDHRLTRIVHYHDPAGFVGSAPMTPLAAGLLRDRTGDSVPLSFIDGPEAAPGQTVGYGSVRLADGSSLVGIGLGAYHHPPAQTLGASTALGSGHAQTTSVASVRPTDARPVWMGAAQGGSTEILRLTYDPDDLSSARTHLGTGWIDEAWLKTTDTLNTRHFISANPASRFYLDPDSDADGDGIRLLDERLWWNTNPDSLDTDGDGLHDDYEISYRPVLAGLGGTVNPGAPDAASAYASQSPRTQLRELQVGQGDLFNPLVKDDPKADFDRDGLPNYLESSYGSHPGLSDTDGDGVSDLKEHEQGSSPVDPSDLGLAPPLATKERVSVTVGDPSPSHSEQWALEFNRTTPGGPGSTERVRLMAPDHGLVITEDFWFDVGADYTGVIQHVGSNTDPPDYDWTADVKLATELPPEQADRPRAALTVTEVNNKDEPVLPGGSDFNIDEGKIIVRLRPSVEIDLDVDSDNTAGLYGGPDGTDEEDEHEDAYGDPEHPGKILLANTLDHDRDLIPDYADGFGLDVGMPTADRSTGARFTPLNLEVTGVLELVPEAVLRIDYAASVPLEIQATPSDLFALPQTGNLRLWNLDASTARNGESLLNGGNFVAPGVYSFAELGLRRGASSGQLWLEAVGASDVIGGDRITASVGTLQEDDVAGETFLTLFSDTVGFTAVEVQLEQRNTAGGGWVDANGFLAADLRPFPDGSVPDHFVYRFAVEDPRFEAETITLGNHDLSLSGGSVRYSEEFGVARPGQAGMADSSYLILSAGEVDFSYNPNGSYPVEWVDDVAAADREVAAEVDRAVTDMHGRWAAPAPEPGNSPNPGAFGNEVHRRVSERLQGRPGWLVDVVVDEQTNRVVKIGGGPGGSGTTQVDLIKLRSGVSPEVGDVLAKEDIKGVYDIKSSASGNVPRAQRLKLKVVSQGGAAANQGGAGEVKVTRTRYRWTAGGGWTENLKVARSLKVMSAFGLTTTASAFVHADELDAELLDVVAAFEEAKRVDLTQRPGVLAIATGKFANYLSHFDPSGNVQALSLAAFLQVLSSDAFERGDL